MMPKKLPSEVLESGSLKEIKALFEEYRLPDSMIDEGLLEKYKAKNKGKPGLGFRKNRTFLHFAVLNPNPEIIDFLLKKMTEYHHKDTGYAELEQYFLTHRDDDQRTLLHYAAENKNVERIAYLFDKLCKIRKSSHPHETDREIKQYLLGQKDIDQYTPLTIAVLKGIFPAIKFFIENGANYKEVKVSSLNMLAILKHDGRGSIAKKVKALILEIEKNPIKEDQELSSSNIIERPLSSIEQRDSDTEKTKLDSLLTENTRIPQEEGFFSSLSSWVDSLGLFSFKSKSSDKKESSLKEPLLPSKLKLE